MYPPSGGSINVIKYRNQVLQKSGEKVILSSILAAQNLFFMVYLRKMPVRDRRTSVERESEFKDQPQRHVGDKKREPDSMSVTADHGII